MNRTEGGACGSGGGGEVLSGSGAGAAARGNGIGSGGRGGTTVSGGLAGKPGRSAPGSLSRAAVGTNGRAVVEVAVGRAEGDDEAARAAARPSNSLTFAIRVSGSKGLARKPSLPNRAARSWSNGSKAPVNRR